MSFIKVLSISLVLGISRVVSDDSCHASTDDSLLLSQSVRLHDVALNKVLTGSSEQSTSKLLEEMRNLARKVSAGEEKISDETKKVLGGIDDEMDKILAEAEKVHKNDQAEVNERRDAIQICSTKASEHLAIVGSKKSAMEGKLTEHNTARARQQSEMIDMTTKCNDFQSFWSTDTTPACLAVYPGSSQASAKDCLKEVAGWQQRTNQNFDNKKNLCDEATTKLQATIGECESIQGAFETSTCAYSSKLTDTCENQETCRTREIAARESTHARVKDDETSRKNEFTAASKIKCYLDVLRAEGAAQTAKLAECEKLQPDKSSVHMDYPEVPAETTCDPKPAEKKPCTDEWLGFAYSNQGWYNKESQNTYTSSTERVSPRKCDPCDPPAPVTTQVPTTQASAPQQATEWLQDASWPIGASSSSTATHVGTESAVCSGRPRNCPSNIMDGDEDTVWHCNSASPCELEFDLQEPRALAGIRLLGFDNRFTEARLYSSSDGSTWSFVEELHVHDNQATVEIDNGKAQHWKLTHIMAGNGSPGLKEVWFKLMMEEQWSKGEQGQSCPQGYMAITYQSTCTAACNSLGITTDNMQSFAWGTGYPQGCFVNTQQNDDQYSQGCLFNTGSGGNGTGTGRAICQLEAAAVTSAPTTAAPTAAATTHPDRGYTYMSCGSNGWNWKCDNNADTVYVSCKRILGGSASDKAEGCFNQCTSIASDFTHFAVHDRTACFCKRSSPTGPFDATPADSCSQPAGNNFVYKIR